MKLVKFSDYYNIGDEQLNEGYKKWLSIFLISSWSSGGSRSGGFSGGGGSFGGGGAGSKW